MCITSLKFDMKIWNKEEREREFTRHQDNMNTFGYTVADDFLPESVADEICQIYKDEVEGSWERFDQVRPDHYQHVFKSPNPLLPTPGQIYTAKFWRSRHIEANKRIQSILTEYFRKTISKMSGINLTVFDDRCYRLTHGDHYRVHIDDYAGVVNSIYYVNKEWTWDWGGILNVCSHDDHEFSKAIFPKFNRLVLLYNRKFRSPHFVSQVSEFAGNPRYSIVGFNN